MQKNYDVLIFCIFTTVQT